MLSTFLLGFGVGQFVIGPLSDRYGRRPVLIGGMILYGIASMLTLIAPSFETLLLARAPAGAVDRGDAGDRDVGGARLLRRTADGERDVARADDFHLGAGAGALARPSWCMLASHEWHSVFAVLLRSAS